MKRLVFLLAAGYLSTAVPVAQDIHPNLRSLDNNEALAADSNDHHWSRAIKQIPMSDTDLSVLSFGGEIREQLRYFDNLNHGDTDPGVSDDDLYLLQRYLLHADFQLGHHMRFFSQLGSMHVSGKNSLSHTDKEPLSVMQAFAEFHTHNKRDFQLRIGRQDLSFANERFMGTRDGPNVRQTYDGLSASLSGGQFRAVFLVVSPMIYQYGTFDNEINRHVLFFGTYLTLANQKQGSIDLYYFGSHRESTLALYSHETEMRHTFGIRPYARFGSFYVDGEFEMQGGKYGDNLISAWQLAAFAGYRFDNLPLQPRVQIRINAGSGDRDSTDNRLNLFRPLVVKSPIHDLLANGCGNLFVFSPEVEFRIHPQLLFAARYYLVHRASTNDGLYTVDMERLVRDCDQAGIRPGKVIDRGATIDVSWTPDKHFGMLIAGGFFVPGNYVKNTGSGETTIALSIKLTYRF